MVSALFRWPVILLVAALAWSGSAVLAAAEQSGRFPAGSGIRAQPQPPLPDGQRITAADGDTVVIEGDARVHIIRRRPAFVRMIANVEQRFVVILTENLREYGDSPTRLSEKTYSFNGLHEPWPLAPRWEGTVWLEEYFPAGSHAGAFGGTMLGIDTPDGKIVFGSGGSELPPGEEARTITVRFQGMGMGGGGRQPFDQEEVRALAMAAQNGASSAQGPIGMGGMNGPVGAGGMNWVGMGSGGVGFTSGMTMSSGEIGPPPPVGAPPMSAPPLPAGAVRAGGNIVPPRKIHNADPVMPDLARSARISGTVILEITIGIDGGVSDARVLRSIPLLDQAALDAVRQWKYEPTLLNGQPVPVLITVPVSFAP